MTDPTPPTGSWGTCSLCGDAVPPGATSCPTCGNPGAVSTPQEFRKLPRQTRWWMRFVRALRVVVIVGLVVALGYAMVSATLSGPPSVNDPLTTTGAYLITPANNTYLSGEITGEDYVVGNYTVMNPIGLDVVFAIYNSTEYAIFAEHQNASALYYDGPAQTGRIIFAAPYTDTFYLVFSNPYPTGPQVLIYAQTNYESNVVID
ncbi:MAG: hypothetical protein WB778_07880 [Thermoplasmata archaeon]